MAKERTSVRMQDQIKVLKGQGVSIHKIARKKSDGADISQYIKDLHWVLDCSI